MVLEDDKNIIEEESIEINKLSDIIDESSDDTKQTNYQEEKNEINEKDQDQEDEDKEVISEKPLQTVYDKTDKTLSGELLEGGGAPTMIFNIDFIIPEDEKLINIEKVNKQVDKYIENYNNPEMKKYNNNYKNLYQKYSNKKHTITISEIKLFNKIRSKIIVYKNETKLDKNRDKKKPETKLIETKKTLVFELIKPHYLYYNKDCKLTKMKMEISNARNILLYKYESLTNKLILAPEEKKEFEKERLNFIELLETYYTYTLYHKKINNIINTNKSNLIIQEQIQVYKDNSDEYNMVLSGNIYTIDKSIIDILNKFNSDKLTKYNNLIMNLNGKESKDISKNKKLIEDIKTYIDKTEIKTIIESNKKNFEQQEKYINYIVLELPNNL